MSKTYKIVKNNKNIENAIILKSGLEAKITIRELAQDVREWVKLKKENLSNRGIFKAMIINIEQNYPMVRKMTDEEMEAITVFYQKKQQLKIANENITNLDKNYKNYSQEFPEIKKALNITQETDLDMAFAEYKGIKDEAGSLIKKHEKANKRK